MGAVNCVFVKPNQEQILKPGERVACDNATVIEDENGEFAGWYDNGGVHVVAELWDWGSDNE